MADEGRFPWRRLLVSLLGALLVATTGFFAHLADVQEPRPLHAVVEVVTLPFVRLVHFMADVRRGPVLQLAVVSSVLLWWAVLFVLLTLRARKRDANRGA